MILFMITSIPEQLGPPLFFHISICLLELRNVILNSFYPLQYSYIGLNNLVKVISSMLVLL